MKKFLALILLAMAIAVSSPIQAYADVNTNGLTEEQSLQLQQQALQMRKQTEKEKVEKTVQKDQANEIKETVKTGLEVAGQFGSSLGIALVNTAKEMGIAVNEFAKTDVGKLTVAIIVFKMFGGMLIHVCVGAMFLVVASTVWFYLFRRTCIIKSIEKLPTADGKKTTKKIEYYTTNDRTYERTAWWIILEILICLVSFVTMFTW